MNNIEAILGDLDNKVTELSTLYQVSNSRYEEDHNLLKQLRDAVKGNGKDGLEQKHALLRVEMEAEVKGINTRLVAFEEFTKEVKRIGIWLVLTGAGILIALIANLILSHGPDLVK